MSGAYADADDATTTMQQVQAHHHRRLVRALQASVAQPVNVIAHHINVAMATTAKVSAQ